MSRNTRRAVVLSAVALCYMTLGVSIAEAGTAAPTISKAFNPTSITSGGTSTITLTLVNASPLAQTNGVFSDTLTNMAISGAQIAGGTCVGAGSNNFLNGATAVSFTGLTIPASGNCTATVLVTSSTVGPNNNSTSGVMTTQSGATGPVSNTAILTVTASTPVRLQSFDVN